MTPRRSSGGPQCAFEENKKRERAPSGGASEGAEPRERAAGCCLAKPRWDRGATGRHFGGGGRGGDLGSRGARSDPAQRGAGCDLCLGGLHF